MATIDPNSERRSRRRTRSPKRTREMRIGDIRTDLPTSVWAACAAGAVPFVLFPPIFVFMAIAGLVTSAAVFSVLYLVTSRVEKPPPASTFGVVGGVLVGGCEAAVFVFASSGDTPSEPLNPGLAVLGVVAMAIWVGAFTCFVNHKLQQPVKRPEHLRRRRERRRQRSQQSDSMG